MAPSITNVQLHRASEEKRSTGLLYWASCRVDGRWALNGLAIRRTLKGATVVTFPSRRDSTGRDRPYITPLDAETREAVEEALLEELLWLRTQR